ncbi:MAG TPA: RluA family pseudouridine synthase [Ktedonobacterales bacterium]|nr:RluA family pseudouridine synthase [Ktedonobacterales bacterium]
MAARTKKSTPQSMDDSTPASTVIEVTEMLDGERLDRALAQLYPELSRTRAQTAIKAGAARVNGKTVRVSHLLEVGQRIEVDAGALSAAGVAAAEGESPPQAEAIPLRVVYEDEHLLVVDKAAGLVVHPAPGHATGTLVNALLAHLPGLEAGSDASRPGIVHRLDKDTSGLIVIAKDAPTHAALAQQMKEHSTVKRYLALVEGRMPAPEGVIDAPIGRDPRHRQRMALVSEVNGGREARTRFKTLREIRGRSLVELQLETGRTHQIRVHLASVGHPVVGDTVYGRAQLPLPPRQFLHATHLEFVHPTTGAWLIFDAPLPPDLADFLAAQE